MEVDLYNISLDGLGSVVNLTDESGTVIASYSYDAFGSVTSSEEKLANSDFLFTGRQFDPESGLYFYRNRYYDSKVGKFTTRDPIGIRGGINLYGYCGNDPVNWVDPWGLDNQDTPSDPLWGQVVGGVVDFVGGASAAVASGILMTKTSGLGAAALYPTFVESLALAGYGIAEIITGMIGDPMPSSVDIVKDVFNNTFSEHQSTDDNSNK